MRVMFLLQLAVTQRAQLIVRAEIYLQNFTNPVMVINIEQSWLAKMKGTDVDHTTVVFRCF